MSGVPTQIVIINEVLVHQLASWNCQSDAFVRMVGYSYMAQTAFEEVCRLMPCYARGAKGRVPEGQAFGTNSRRRVLHRQDDSAQRAIAVNSVGTFGTLRSSRFWNVRVTLRDSREFSSRQNSCQASARSQNSSDAGRRPGTEVQTPGTREPALEHNSRPTRPLLL